MTPSSDRSRVVVAKYQDEIEAMDPDDLFAYSDHALAAAALLVSLHQVGEAAYYVHLANLMRGKDLCLQ